MEYRTIFKCRLCGKSSEPQAPTLTEAHICVNGDIGVADFQGFRKVEEK